MSRTHLSVVVLVSLLLLPFTARAHESICLEAEWMHGIKSYCWPMGKPEMKKTTGNWGLFGPGWAAE